jgi:hypothetical protein
VSTFTSLDSVTVPWMAQSAVDPDTDRFILYDNNTYKCLFAQPSICVLVHVVNSEGIAAGLCCRPL